MNFWGYLVLLFIGGCMVEDYQHQKHLNELEKIELKGIVHTEMLERIIKDQKPNIQKLNRKLEQ